MSYETNTLVLVANHTKPLYDDRKVNGIIYYTGMGSKGDQSLDFMQNLTLRKSKTNGVDVHFFEVFIEKRYTYQGQVVLAGEPFQEEQDDKDGNNRKVWVFPLKKCLVNPLL